MTRSWRWYLFESCKALNPPPSVAGPGCWSRSSHCITSSRSALRCPPSAIAAAPYVRGMPLWDHCTYFKSLVDFYRLRAPTDDFRIQEIVRFLSTLPVRRDAAIAVVGPPHAFFHRNGLQFESIRQQREWQWISEVSVTDAAQEVIIPDVDVVILRGDEIHFGPQQVSLREVRSFELGDGSIGRVFVSIDHLIGKLAAPSTYNLHNR